MANFTSVEAFARELQRMERQIEAKRRDIGTKVATDARPEGYRAAAAKLGGDPKFSGWRPWLELKVKPKNYGAAIIPTRYSAGPWTVGQDGRHADGGPGGGFLGPGINSRSGETNLRFRKSGGVIIRSRKARRWNGVTRGKGIADDAKRRFEKVAETVGEKEFRLVLKQHFSVD